jgi:hypothetical protein
MKGIDQLKTLIAIAFGMLLLAAAPARAQDPVIPLSPNDQQLITTQLGPGVVGQALPSKQIADTTTYFPLKAQAMSYHVTSGSHAGNTQSLGVAKTRRPSGRSAWRFLISPTLSGFIHQTAEGDLVMPAVVDYDEGVVVITTPANPFVLNGMKPGESRSFTQQVAVNHLDDPTDEEYSGSLQGTYKYLGTYKVTVPAGTYNAVLFRVKSAGKVGPAHTKDTAYYFFAPNVGAVAMIMQEDVVAFWLYHVDSSSGKVLMQ